MLTLIKLFCLHSKDAHKDLLKQRRDKVEGRKNENEHISSMVLNSVQQPGPSYLHYEGESDLHVPV